MPEAQTGFRKGRGTRDHIRSIRWILKLTKKHQREMNFCFIDYSDVFDSVDQEKIRNVLKAVGVPQYLILLMRHFYSGQEASARTEQGETEWFTVEKDILQNYILSSYLFNLYTEHIIREAGLDEDEGEIKLGAEKSAI